MTLTREILHIINGLLTVEELTFLYDRYCKTDWETVYIFKPIIIGKLIKAGYLDAEHNVTEKGGTLIEKLFGALQMNAGYKKPDKASLNKDDPFKQFWITYPRTNKYLHFPATKVLRANEKKVRTLYVQLIKEGKVTHDDLMFALQAEIKVRIKRIRSSCCCRYRLL